MSAELLSCTDYLPLAWEKLHAPLSDAQRQAMSNANQQVLAAVAALEEHRKPIDEEASLENEVIRLHQKMDLLLQLVSALARAQIPQPEPKAVRMSSADLICQGYVGEAGEGVIEVHLHPCIAQPLRLPAVLAPRTEDGSAHFTFMPLDESCTVALERHVFLHHRRSVAEARLSQKR